MKTLLLTTALVILSGCAVVDRVIGRDSAAQTPSIEDPRPTQRPDGTEVQTASVDSDAIGGSGQSPESLDVTTPEERAAATAPVAGGSALGQTIASLGDPTEPGFWLKTPLVDAETPGRVETAGGAIVQVTLIPIEGAASAGSRMSLAAMRALGLGLTDLATVSVFRG